MRAALVAADLDGLTRGEVGGLGSPYALKRKQYEPACLIDRSITTHDLRQELVGIFGLVIRRAVSSAAIWANSELAVWLDASYLKRSARAVTVIRSS